MSIKLKFNSIPNRFMASRDQNRFSDGNGNDGMVPISSQTNTKDSCDARFNEHLSRTSRDIKGNRIESKYEQKNMGLRITFAQGSPYHKLVLKLVELHGDILKFGIGKGGNANKIDKDLKDLFDGLTFLKDDCKDQLSPYQKTVLMGKIREVEKLKGQWENLQTSLRPTNSDFWGGARQSLLGITKTTAEGFGQLFNATAGEAIKSLYQKH